MNFQKLGPHFSADCADNNDKEIIEWSGDIVVSEMLHFVDSFTILLDAKK